LGQNYQIESREEHKYSNVFGGQGPKKQSQGGKTSKNKARNYQIATNSKSQSDLFQKTQAQCLGHLISIIKIFLQAAILSKDEK
jgi:hypothetical protein